MISVGLLVVFDLAIEEDRKPKDLPTLIALNYFFLPTFGRSLSVSPSDGWQGIFDPTVCRNREREGRSTRALKHTSRDVTIACLRRIVNQTLVVWCLLEV
jgi:hypothetical protein